MKGLVHTLIAAIGLSACALGYEWISEPVDDDSFEFCPAEDEVLARNLLRLGNARSRTEAEFRSVLWRNGIYFERYDDPYMEICGSSPDQDITAIYYVREIYPRRECRGGPSNDFIVTFDSNGMLKQIQSEFVIYCVH